MSNCLVSLPILLPLFGERIQWTVFQTTGRFAGNRLSELGAGLGRVMATTSDAYNAFDCRRQNAEDGVGKQACL